MMILFVLLLCIGVSAKTCASFSSPKFKSCKVYQGPKLDISDFDIYQKGANDKLSELLRTHQKTHKYTCLWMAIAETDQETLDSLSLILWYKSTSVKIKSRDCGQNDPNAWNREHIWAKSRGFPKKKSLAYRDLHHIRASDRSLNTWRSNRYFAEFSQSEELMLKRNQECPQGCFRDKSYFEPPAWRKGDIARALLYMDLRYNGHPKDKTPDLQILVSYPDRASQARYWGGLCTLLNWHNEDPPDELENYRHSVIQEWQGNPNPFILKPQWADILYGSSCKKL